MSYLEYHCASCKIGRVQQDYERKRCKQRTDLLYLPTWNRQSWNTHPEAIMHMWYNTFAQAPSVRDGFSFKGYPSMLIFEEFVRHLECYLFLGYFNQQHH